jgi:protein-S-isoprenylcysteine O-methyltransferase Ste14
MRRTLSLLYGLAAYTIFFGTFCYAVGFVMNVGVPKSIDSGTPGPFWPSLLVNAVLLAVFAVQHSVMARPGFKRVWTKVVPKPIERSTFVLFSCAALILMFWQWRPLGGEVWTVQNSAARAVLTAVGWSGWLIVFASTWMIHHFDLFGVRQVVLHARGERYRDLGFRTPALYKHVRHPIMLGFLIAFWATPDMSYGRLLFALLTTGYILVGIQLEERDLRGFYGARYDEYRKHVPMLIPRGVTPPVDAYGASRYGSETRGQAI